VLRLLDFFTAYLAGERAMPSSLDVFRALGAAALPDQRDSLRASVRHWAQVTGHARPDTDREVA
jgi:hypothetical protein